MTDRRDALCARPHALRHVAEVRGRIAGLRLPVGYGVEVGGQYAAQQRAFRELLVVFGISAALVLLIMHGGAPDGAGLHRPFMRGLRESAEMP